MAITTYSELKTSIADYLNRADLTSIIPTFIALAEAQINRDVRHWSMENRATTSFDGQYGTRPSDWVATIRMHLTGNGTKAMNLISQQAMAEKRANDNDTAGTPMFYAHSESQFELYPTHDQATTAEILYYQKGPCTKR